MIHLEQRSYVTHSPILQGPVTPFPSDVLWKSGMSDKRIRSCEPHFLIGQNSASAVLWKSENQYRGDNQSTHLYQQSQQALMCINTEKHQITKLGIFLDLGDDLFLCL